MHVGIRGAPIVVLLSLSCAYTRSGTQGSLLSVPVGPWEGAGSPPAWGGCLWHCYRAQRLCPKQSMEGSPSRSFSLQNTKRGKHIL